MRLSKVQIRLGLLLGVCVLLLATTPLVLATGPPFKPNYDAEFSSDITGGGPVKAEGYIHSYVRYNDYPLTFGEVFSDFIGDHYGYLAIFPDKRSGTAEFFYTYGPEPDENGLHYQLHGWGAFESNKKAGMFCFTPDGEYTISQEDG